MTTKTSLLAHKKFTLYFAKSKFFYVANFLIVIARSDFLTLVIQIYKKIATWQSHGSVLCADGSIDTLVIKCI